MQIEILGTESLGVRGLCCAVRTKGRKVVIDPGVALGFRRHGLLPHPVQVAASEDS
jgi:predicted metallo-beta-lactamase superfamily hydrolase